MNPIVYAIPVFLGTVALEAFLARRQGKAVYDIPDMVTSLSAGTVSQVMGLFYKLLGFAIYIAVFNAFAVFHWPTDNLWLWALALLLYDFLYYWAHRMGHEVAVMWASHIVHHSSEYYNLSTALRQTATGGLLGWMFYLPLAVLGVPPLMLAVVGLIDLLYQYWVHTQLVGRIGWLEKILVSPSNHRVHHGQNDYCIDVNYGGILIIWDRLFGTFADERDDEPVVYGVRSALASYNPLWANFHYYAWLAQETRRTPGWRAKVNVWLGPPGGWPEGPLPSFDATEFQRFGKPTTAALRWYVAAQYGGMVALLLHLLLRADALSIGQQIGYAAVIIGVATVIGALLEQRPWARVAEFARLALFAGAALLPKWFGDAAPLWARALVVVLAAGSALWLWRATAPATAPSMGAAPAE
jgi:sterol desaturase/sphingolipid hydroxylase (fatty acid hydroxylase superfamily)